MGRSSGESNSTRIDYISLSSQSTGGNSSCLGSAVFITHGNNGISEILDLATEIFNFHQSNFAGCDFTMSISPVTDLIGPGETKSTYI